MKKVAVIGAGPSGITAIKNFNDHGFEVTAFERCEGVGGNWRFIDPSGHSSVFETTHIISSKYTFIEFETIHILLALEPYSIVFYVKLLHIA